MNNRVREKRLAKDISQVDLALAINASRQTIHAIETSKYVPSVELALRIAKTLRLKVEDLFQLERDEK